MKRIVLILVVVLFITCSKESKQESLLDQLDSIVWTRGTNYKIFKSNPFRLILIEDGTCLEFTENPKMIMENEFQYTLLENSTDTLKLGYKVTGERLNHCGTFTYFIDEKGELVRSYEECNTFYQTNNVTNFYSVEKDLGTLCPELQD